MGNKRVAAVDFGLARIGLAISDGSQIIAQSLNPLAAQKKQSQNAKLLLEALSTYELEVIVVGNPLHLNGKVGFMADEVNHFVSELQKICPCEVVLLDERLTSKQAERTLREANMSRKKRKKVIDSMSAVILLQDYLASKSSCHQW